MCSIYSFLMISGGTEVNYAQFDKDPLCIKVMTGMVSGTESRKKKITTSKTKVITDIVFSSF